MRLTTKGRFAVTAMIDLALRQNAGPVTLAAISQRQSISLSYLEQLFGKLRRNGLAVVTRSGAIPLKSPLQKSSPRSMKRWMPPAAAAKKTAAAAPTALAAAA
jgi:hypothetical protein